MLTSRKSKYPTGGEDHDQHREHSNRETQGRLETVIHTVEGQHIHCTAIEDLLGIELSVIKLVQHQSGPSVTEEGSPRKPCPP